MVKAEFQIFFWFDRYSSWYIEMFGGGEVSMVTYVTWPECLFFMAYNAQFSSEKLYSNENYLFQIT